MTSEERLRKAVSECMGQPIHPLSESDALIEPLYAFVRDHDAQTLVLRIEQERSRNLKRELGRLRDQLFAPDNNEVPAQVITAVTSSAALFGSGNANGEYIGEVSLPVK